MSDATTASLLAACRKGYAEAVERLDRLLDGLSADAARMRPAPKAWSVVECLDHVAITNGLYADRLEPALAAARERGPAVNSAPGRGTLLGGFILRNLRQGAKARKVPAPGTFRPAPVDARELADVAASLREGLARYAALAAGAEGLPIGRVRFATPAVPLLRVTAAEAFEMAHLHTLRHLGQAERARATIEGKETGV